MDHHRSLVDLAGPMTLLDLDPVRASNHRWWLSLFGYVGEECVGEKNNIYQALENSSL